MNESTVLNPEIFLGKTYRKRHAAHAENILFVSFTEFWYQVEGSDWSIRPYRVRRDGFELDWGNGDVNLCIYIASSSQFLELNPQQMCYWEPVSDAKSPSVPEG